jgi:hypothetical protein
MDTQPPNRPLGHILFDLRQNLAKSLIIADVIHELGPTPEAARLLPNLYTELATLQGVVRKARHNILYTRAE